MNTYDAMTYIRVRIRSRQQDEGRDRMHCVVVHRLRGDWGTGGYDLPLLMHALSARGWQTEASGPFILDVATLESDRWLLG